MSDPALTLDINTDLPCIACSIKTKEQEVDVDLFAKLLNAEEEATHQQSAILIDTNIPKNISNLPIEKEGLETKTSQTDPAEKSVIPNIPAIIPVQSLSPVVNNTNYKAEKTDQYQDTPTSSINQEVLKESPQEKLSYDIADVEQLIANVVNEYIPKKEVNVVREQNEQKNAVPGIYHHLSKQIEEQPQPLTQNIEYVANNQIPLNLPALSKFVIGAQDNNVSNTEMPADFLKATDNNKFTPQFKYHDQINHHHIEPIDSTVTGEIIADTKPINLSFFQGDPKVITEAASTKQAATPLIQQVGMHVQQAIKEGYDQVTVRLNPPALGKIDIELNFEQERRASVTMTFDNFEAMDLLQHHPIQLREALAEAGFQSENTDFTFHLNQDNNSNKQNPQGNERNADGKKQEQSADLTSYWLTNSIDSNRKIDIHA